MEEGVNITPVCTPLLCRSVLDRLEVIADVL